MMDDPPRLVADAPVVGPDYAGLLAAARAAADSLAGDSGLAYLLDLRAARPTTVADAAGAPTLWTATAHIVMPSYSYASF